MSDAFGYGGGYTPTFDQQDTTIMGVPLDPVSKGPAGFDAGSFQGQEAQMFGGSPLQAQKFVSPMEEMNKSLGLGLSGLSGYGDLDNPFLQTGVDPSTKGGFIRDQKYMTPESMAAQKIGEFDYEKLRGLGAEKVSGMSGLFGRAGQTLANVTGDVGYRDKTRQGYGNYFDYDKLVGQRESSLNDAYQTMVNKLQKSYFL